MAQAEHFSLKYVAVLNNNTSGLIAQVFEDNSIVPLPWVVSFFYHHTNETIHINFSNKETMVFFDQCLNRLDKCIAISECTCL